MKYISLCLLLLGIHLTYAQNFKVIKDEPKDCANLWINFELLQFEVNMNNARASNLGAGLSAIFQVKNRFGIEFAARHSYYQLHFKGTSRFQLEGGGFLNFAQFTKSKTRSLSGFKPNVKSLVSIGARAGYASNKESLMDKPLVSGWGSQKYGGGDFKYQFGGIYAGLLFSGQRNYQISTANGVKGYNILKRYYIDFLFYPTQVLTDRSSGSLYPGFKPSPFGGRFGYERLYPEKKKNFGGASYLKLEVGYRPVDGVYFMLTYGISWKEKFGKLNGFVQEREKE